MNRTLSMQTFLARHADDTFVLDVHEPAEYVAGHVPGAVLAATGRPLVSGARAA
jgi:rhodanese-related sulfurtransferase